MVCKFEHGSCYLQQYFQLGDRSKNDRAYRRFPDLCTAVTTDDDISSYVTETEMTVHIGFLNLCTACASIPYKLDLFFLSRTCDKTKRTMKRISMKQIVKETQYGVNGNFND